MSYEEDLTMQLLGLQISDELPDNDSWTASQIRSCFETWAINWLLDKTWARFKYGAIIDDQTVKRELQAIGREKNS